MTSSVVSALERLRRSANVLSKEPVSAAALNTRADALRGLAALLRLGYPARLALADWPDHSPPDVRGSLVEVARAVRLGLPTEDAVNRLVAFEQDRHALATVLSIASRLGGDVAAMVESLAASTDRRRAAVSAARSASSGAKLSGRLVAGLPLAFIPLAPMSQAPLFDGSGALTILAGAVLAAAGMMWISRLTPSPDRFDDPTASLAELIAATLVGGANLVAALDTIADSSPGPIEREMRRAKRLVDLGLSWPQALRRIPDRSMRQLGSTLDRAQELGLPVASALGAFAGDLRSQREREFEEKNKRATVLMMIPLATCVLPSFILLAIGPFLRGLSLQ